MLAEVSCAYTELRKQAYIEPNWIERGAKLALGLSDIICGCCSGMEVATSQGPSLRRGLQAARSTRVDFAWR